jgi:hypothetical protein
MDIDDAWLSLVPEPAGFQVFIEAAARAQARQGGNIRIGRELGQLLEAAGYSDVAVHVEMVNSR